jgi:predicted ATPase
MPFSKIEIESVLSFKHVELELRRLNVLIGANASGKSNLVRVLGLLRSLPSNMSQEIAAGGGPRGWINQRITGHAKITLFGDDPVFTHQIVFGEVEQRYEIVSETLECGDYQAFRRSFKRYQLRNGQSGELGSEGSLLQFLRHPDLKDIGDVASALSSWRLYREFRTGPQTQARYGVSAASLGDSLLEDGSNLALVLNERNLIGGLSDFNDWLRRFFDRFQELVVLTRGGVAQLYVREEGISTPLSAASLSDGTLRLLCLLVVLLDPAPPPLVCIEEPEAGLHPDAIRMIADLLVNASTKTQLVVTTHSPTLIDALSGEPESVVVCERDLDGFSQFRRLERSQMEIWLDEYTLGDLWQRGEIGGNRW